MYIIKKKLNKLKFYFIKDSLKNETDKILKKENPNLFESRWEKFIHYINDHKKWYIIVLFVFVTFFSLQFINIQFLNFIQIDSDSVKNLIDNRTVNIVTMISVTFAIIGFLIANLAIKDSFTYNLLFKKSSFFPITFFALTLIAVFIILSTIKDTFSIIYQTRTLLVGTWLILVVIFLIGYLFVKLVKFTNQKYILKLVKKELINESKRGLLFSIRKKISANKISELGFNNYSMAFFIPKIKGNFQIPKEHKIIADIKLQRLKELSEKINRNDFYINKLFLYRKLIQTNEDGFFFVEENKLSKNSDNLRKLNNCIITSTKSVEQNNEAKDYIIQKLDENIKSNNYKLVEEYFNMLFEMYKLQQSFNYSNMEDKITNGIKTDILKMVNKAMLSNSVESFNEIDKFCCDLLNLSISNKYILHFEEFLYIAIYYYTLLYIII